MIAKMTRRAGESVREIVGSIHTLGPIDRQLFGTIQFSSDAAAQVWATRWNDGFLSERNLKLDFEIDQGMTVLDGKSYHGYDGPFTVAQS